MLIAVAIYEYKFYNRIIWRSILNEAENPINFNLYCKFIMLHESTKKLLIFIQKTVKFRLIWLYTSYKSEEIGI